MPFSLLPKMMVPGIPSLTEELLKKRKDKMKSLLMNRRGSILQIVLIVFMLLTLALSITSFYILQSASQLHSISLLLKQKNLEIFLVKY